MSVSFEEAQLQTHLQRLIATKTNTISSFKLVTQFTELPQKGLYRNEGHK